MSPQVSVIVPTYRRAQLLELTLESVRAQSFEAWECLVCEDGDDPATAELLRGLSARDPRFRHLPLPHSGRPGRTRNAGLREARGSHCAFLDDDDLWLPHKLRAQADLAASLPAAGVLCSRIEEFGAREALWPAGPVPARLEFQGLARANLVATSTVFARTDLLRELGGFSEELPRAQDYDLWLRCAQRAPVVFQDEVLCRYRTHAGNISGDRPKSLDCIESILRRLHAEGALSSALLYARLAELRAERSRHVLGLLPKGRARGQAAGASVLALYHRLRGT